MVHIFQTTSLLTILQLRRVKIVIIIAQGCAALCGRAPSSHCNLQDVPRRRAKRAEDAIRRCAGHAIVAVGRRHHVGGSAGRVG